MQQTIPKYDYSRARNVIVPRSITPEKSKVTTDQELLKVEQIFSRVNEVFSQRQHTNKLLANEVRDNECQLKFLEKQIREQIDTNAFQNASLALTSHNLSRLTTEVSNYVSIDFETLTKGFESIQENMSESNTIAATLFRELDDLVAIEKSLQEELNDLNKQLQAIMSELNYEEKKSTECSLKYDSLVEEENECQLKIQESNERLLDVSQRLEEMNIACKKAEFDANSLQQKLGCETAALAQRSPDLGPQGAALEAVVNIAKETARCESLSQAVAKLKDHAKLAEVAIAQCAAMSTGLKNKIKVSMLTSESNSREIKSLCAKKDILLNKESGVSAKIGIIESEIAIECEAIVTFEEDKRDLENVVTENAREIERCYENACQRMKELKDLNEERPRLLQQLNTVQCTLKTKLDKLKEQVAFALIEQRTLQENNESHLADIAAKEKLLQFETLHHQNGISSYNILESSVDSLRHNLQTLASEKQSIGDAISLLERKISTVEECDEQMGELDTSLAKYETIKASVLEEINKTRAMLINCRSAPPTANELPDRITEAVNVEIDGEWIPIAADLTVFHERDVQEMRAMLRQLEAGFPTTDDSEMQQCNENLASEIESSKEAMNALGIAIVEAESQNAAKEVLRLQRLKELKEEEALILQRQKEDEAIRMQRLKQEEELRLRRLKEEADLKRLQEERLQRLQEEEKIRLQREIEQKHEEEELRRRAEEDELNLRLQLEREIQIRLQQAKEQQRTPQQQSKSVGNMNQQSQGDELTPNSDSLQLSFVDDDGDAPPAIENIHSSHKRSLSEQPPMMVKSPVIQDNRIRVLEASKESLRAEYHKRSIPVHQSLPSRKDLSSIRKGNDVQRPTPMETAEPVVSQTGNHNDDDMASVYTMSNLFGDSMFAEKTPLPKSQYGAKTQSTVVCNTMSQDNDNALRRKYARMNPENNSSHHQSRDVQKTTQRSTYSSMPTKYHPTQQKQAKSQSRATFNQINSQSIKVGQSQKSQYLSQTQTVNRPITETPKPKMSGSTVRPKNDAAKIPTKASPGDWFLEDEVFK